MQDTQNNRIIHLLIILIIVASCTNMVSAQTAIFTIDSAPVFEEEFVFFAKQNRALTSAHFYHNYKAEQGPDFWTHSYSGETPLDYIQKLTMKKLIEVKTTFLLAKELELMNEITFESFKQEFNRENARRKTGIEEGEILFGSKEFTLETYF